MLKIWRLKMSAWPLHQHFYTAMLCNKPSGYPQHCFAFVAMLSNAVQGKT